MGRSENMGIPLSKISRCSVTNEVLPYLNNKVILWGICEEYEKMTNLLTYFNITPVGFCDCDSTHWGALKNDKFVMSPELLLEFAQSEGFDNMVIQFALPYIEEKKWVDWCKKQGFTQFISTQEAFEVLGYFHLAETSWKEINSSHFPLLQKKNQLSEQIKAEQYLLTEDKAPLFLCMPPKTGDHSLIDTFEKLGISHHFIFHMPSAIPMSTNLPIKIITAVRDPIAENISLLYQILGDLSHSITAHYLISVKEPDFFLKMRDDRNFNSCDVQRLFQHFTQMALSDESFGAPPIQLFLNEFQQKVANFRSHPFDKEKGFTVISTNTAEIFVYQLEKLNDLLPELSAFVGKEIPTLEEGNYTKTKWVGDSYAKALKDLTFSEAYFNDCFEADWVKHFYSLEDIEKMKERWCGQVVNELSLL